MAIGQGAQAPGGILIRTLECLSTGKIICGPCNSVDHLLKTCDAPTIQHLVSETMRDDISVCGCANNTLYLYPLQSSREDPIIHTGRVGLYMTKASVPVEKQAEYVFRNYRSVAEAPKVTKGRHLMGLALCREGKNAAQISAITGIKESVAQRYINAYREGHSMAKDLSVYAGKRISDSLACEAYGAIVAHEESLAAEAGAAEENEEKPADDEDEESESELELSAVDEEEQPEEEAPLAPQMVSFDATRLVPWLRAQVRHAIFETLKGQKKGSRKSVFSVEVSLHPFPLEISQALFKEAMEKATSSSVQKYQIQTYQADGEPELESHTEQQHEISADCLRTLLGSSWEKFAHAPSQKTVQVQSPVLLSLSDSQPEGRCNISFELKLAK